jgi:hypothetical protein
VSYDTAKGVSAWNRTATGGPRSTRASASTLRIVPATGALQLHGKLDCVRKYDVEVGREIMFWMGMVQLPEPAMV